MTYKDIDMQKAYMKAYNAEWHQKNKKDRTARKNHIISTMKCFVADVKNVPCMDCGQKFPTICMDFDHREPQDKVADICVMIRRMSWNNLLAEIDKCDVVCACCHRIRTQSRFV